MSEHKDEPAFPTSQQLYGGLTMRDYFAAQAMAPLVADAFCHNAQPDVWEVSFDEIAAKAYMAADAMLKARGQ